MKILSTIAALVLVATPMTAQQSPTTPDRPVAAPSIGAPRGTGPNGATLRCRDGSYPAAGAPESACDGKGGVLARFPVSRPAQNRPAEAARARPTATPAARPDSAALSRLPANNADQRAAAGVTSASARRPEGATLLCNDGTYVVRDTASVRCAQKGGVKLRFVTRRTP
jgi:hypothetical protein